MILGLHHVTALTRDPQTTVAFYAGVLGLSLVKRTVNYDAPATYHLFFGDRVGRPGSLLTFFAWRDASAARRGKGQAVRLMLSVPRGSLEYWEMRLPTYGFDVQPGGDQVLNFTDPDGLALGLIAVDEPADDDEGAVPGEFAIGGLHGVLLASYQPSQTRKLLSSLGAAPAQDSAALVVGSDPGRNLVLVLPDGVAAPRGSMGAGAVHHVAFRVPDRATLETYRAALEAAAIDVTAIRDRTYFESLYFREPGGILLELATDPPGFAVDEPADELGRRLCLPAWLEGRRDELADFLPALYVPS